MNRAAAWIATWFGCGYFPGGPGTAGSAAAVLMAWLANSWWHFRPVWLLAPTAMLVWPGIWAAGRMAEILQKEDPGVVVVDEVVGQWITLAGATTFNWKSWLAGFVLFRLFDIWKPFPIRRLEALPSGTGIMADDMLAGLYGALVLFTAGCFNLY